MTYQETRLQKWVDHVRYGRYEVTLLAGILTYYRERYIPDYSILL